MWLQGRRFELRTLRLNLGLYAVLGSLNATANWHRMGQLWPFLMGPASTPVGEAEARRSGREQSSSQFLL